MELQSAAPRGGSIRRRRLSLPDLQLARLHGAGQRLGCVADTPYPVLLVLDAEHEWEVQAEAAEEPVRPGQVAIVRTQGGTALDFRYGANAAIVVASKPWVQRWLGAGDEALVRICPAERGWGKILATVLRELAQEPEAAASAGGSTVGDLIGQALAGALRTEPAPRFSVDLLQDARRLCRERLGDPELHGRDVAQMLGVSVRTLSRAFEDAGTTFAESVREMRLQQAAALLAQPELAHLGVAQIGQQCGFVSASHFVREFRRRWGVTPGHARAGSAARQAGSDLLCRLGQALADTRMRVETQKTRVTRMQETQSLQLPAALDLLRTLEESLAALERMQQTAERSNAHGLGPGPLAPF